MSSNTSFIVTKSFIEENRTKGGAWTKKQVNLLGVEWPLKKGWQQKVIGRAISIEAADKFRALSAESEVTNSPTKSTLYDQLDQLEKRIEALENALVSIYRKKEKI